MYELECLDGTILDLHRVPTRDEDVRAVHIDACRMRILELEKECTVLKTRLEACRPIEIGLELKERITDELLHTRYHLENNILINLKQPIRVLMDMTEAEFYEFVDSIALGIQTQPTADLRPTSKKIVFTYKPSEVRVALRHSKPFIAWVLNPRKNAFEREECDPHLMEFSYSRRTNKFTCKLSLSLKD